MVNQKHLWVFLQINNSVTPWWIWPESLNGRKKIDTNYIKTVQVLFLIMYQRNKKIYKLPDSDFTNSKWVVRLDAMGLISMWKIYFSCIWRIRTLIETISQENISLCISIFGNDMVSLCFSYCILEFLFLNPGWRYMNILKTWQIFQNSCSCLSLLVLLMETFIWISLFITKW